MPPKKKTQNQKGQQPQGGALVNDDKNVDDFARELEKDTDSDDAVVINEEPKPVDFSKKPSEAESAFGATDGIPLSDAEKELLKEELKKTEDEIATLKQVLLARQKHSAELKRKLGLSPLAELTQDINKTLKGVTETEAYQKTSEVAAASADAVKGKWNDMRNSSLFKSFESKLGTAYNQAKMAASTSIDQLAGAGGNGKNGSHATTPADEHHSPMQ